MKIQLINKAEKPKQYIIDHLEPGELFICPNFPNYGLMIKTNGSPVELYTGMHINLATTEVAIKCQGTLEWKEEV